MSRIRIAIVALVAVGACSAPLPEEGTAAAELYRSRCGTCHRAVNPNTMKVATWKMVLPRMEQRMASAGETPLGEDQHRVLETYIERNSAK